MQIGTPQVLDGEELVDAVRQMWQPKVVDKMWTFYNMKAKEESVI